jgi:YVTN family beta-propeller protein
LNPGGVGDVAQHELSPNPTSEPVLRVTPKARLCPGRALSTISLLLVVGLLLAALAEGASARNVYVANAGSSSVSVIDAATNGVLGAAPVGPFPRGIAITPDGTRAYVTNGDSNSVSVIDTASNRVAGEAIPVGNIPFAVAITPDGKRAYVTNAVSNDVSVIDTATNRVVGESIKVGEFPEGIAITPDGSRVYVVNEASESVSVIDTASSKVVGEAIPVGREPTAIAITSDGRRAYVPRRLGGVSVIDTANNKVVGEAIPVGNIPFAVAITPDGKRAYVVNDGSNDVTVIDTASNTVLGGAIPVGSGPIAVAVTPDGRRAYVVNQLSKDVSVIDTASNRVVGEAIKVGANPDAIAITPDQAPVASFSLGPLRARPGVPVSFDASASSDRDGAVSTYSWDFGDGQGATLTTAGTMHTYSNPGTYTAALRLTDNEGCSTSLIFTGQTAFCALSPAAQKTATIEVAYPGVRVRCPRRSKPRGCRFRLQAIAARPRRGHKPKIESKTARVKVKPGRSAIVSLRAKPAFRAKLAGANSVLVRETVTIAGSHSVRVRRLKIVQ